ncbi:DUF1707 domain-containing protein [Herbiconiux sp. KACC 21604]|uniref:DUF1707 SHOCT-like domain-containing protein n=1 Tax=unclassified Herbiconiux TaxID=2618217 RepID=UPI001490D3F7|nr:DUF1707 domain-containing protein [Herbiconiux sp. SALV-R1]QJU55542.1 DUF1707 domain-containing protein [Herbiconiux sp. SALV-R1]WPO86729.1 DUF1707 domain-containing protein [Herbiconiux sp. KACC 21604]
MSAYDDPASASIRLSNADRDAAVAALSAAQADGRITPDEYGERSAAAKRAVTRGDLAPLFTDLPESAHPSTGAGTGAASAPPAFAPTPAPAADYGQGGGQGGYADAARRRQPLGGTAGVVAVSVMPFIALGLFFLCGYLIPDGFRWSWVFFALIPIAGIVVYGGGGRRGYYDRD